MWTKYFLTGIVSSFALILASCGGGKTIIDGGTAISHCYENELDIPVKAEYHWIEYSEFGAENKTKTKTIEAGKSLIETISVMGAHECTIMECESFRFIFDDAKELWYYRGTDKTGSVFDINNYTHVQNSKPWRTYYYAISQEIYGLASDIEE